MLRGIATARVPPAVKAGPPKGPAARRVSITRQGVTGTKRRPEPPGLVTTSVAFTVWINELLVPVIVKERVPVGVEVDTFTVRLEAPVTGFTLKVGVAPVGKPLALKVAPAENPLVGFMVTR